LAVREHRARSPRAGPARAARPSPREAATRCRRSCGGGFSFFSPPLPPHAPPPRPRAPALPPPPPPPPPPLLPTPAPTLPAAPRPDRRERFAILPLQVRPVRRRHRLLRGARAPLPPVASRPDASCGPARRTAPFRAAFTLPRAASWRASRPAS